MEAVVGFNPTKPNIKYLFSQQIFIRVIAVRVPKYNDLYLDKTGKIQRCKAFNFSKRAQKRYILREEVYGN